MHERVAAFSVTMLAMDTGLAMGHAVVSHIYKQHHHSLESSANLLRGVERQQYFVLAPKAMGMHQVVSRFCSGLSIE